MTKKKIVCIVGPTASGKTALSIALAKKLDGEVVSCDSMQIYKGMDIGTAKPTASEMQGIPHHMLSIIDPSENYSVARYVDDATAVVEDILTRGKLPVITGGTGLYVDSLVNGTEFAQISEDEDYRSELLLEYKEKGAAYLHRKLFEIDPERAEQIHENNVKRVIRALEIYKVTGKTITEHDNATKLKEARFDATYIGLMFSDRERLYDRINLRVDKMMEDGLCEEVRRLLDAGTDPTATSMQAIGYKEMISYFKGMSTLGDAAESIKQASRRYAKRQMTWFRRNKNINWIEVDKSENISDLLQTSINFISSESV